MKALIKYSPFLFILLLSGSGKLQGSTHNKDGVLFSLTSFNASENTLTADAAIIKAIPSRNEDKIFDIAAKEEVKEEEEDEHDLATLKKNFSGSYFTSITYAHALGYAFNRNGKTFPFIKHFSFVLSYRYIAFQVFRI